LFDFHKYLPAFGRLRPSAGSTFKVVELVKSLIFTMKRMKNMKGQKIYYNFNFMLFMFIVF
jgi:hypothetical protein